MDEYEIRGYWREQWMNGRKIPPKTHTWNYYILPQVLGVLGEYSEPITVRHLYYKLLQLEAFQFIGSKDVYGMLVRKTSEWRKEGLIPYEAFIDNTRTPLLRKEPVKPFSGQHREMAYYTENAFKILRDQFITRYIPEFWRDQPVQIEVWVEKRAIIPQIEELCAMYGVTLCYTSGNASLSFLRDAAERMSSGHWRVIMLSDLDYYGIYLSVDAERTMKSLFGWNGRFKRVAMTPRQVDSYGFSKLPLKELAGDADDVRRDCFEERFPGCDFGCEIDAFSPTEIRDIIKDAMLSFFDVDIRNEVLNDFNHYRMVLNQRFDLYMKEVCLNGLRDDY